MVGRKKFLKDQALLKTIGKSSGLNPKQEEDGEERQKTFVEEQEKNLRNLSLTWSLMSAHFHFGGGQ